MSVARSLILAAILTSTWPLSIALAEPPRIKPENVTWTVSGDFRFQVEKPGKTRESLSGIACPPPSTSPRRCIAVFDEGVEARYVTIDKNTFTTEADPILLLPDGQELDGEAAAREGDTVYVTGSYSPFRGAKKKDQDDTKCDARPDSRHTYRLKIDGQSGKLKVDASGKPEIDDSKSRLWDFMNANKVLDKFVGDKKCLGKPDHAANIEGLAVKNGTLYFGFREPATDQHTYILPVKADELFSPGGIKNAEPIRIQVGRGSGIRDMIAVSDGFLVLIGPDDDSDPGVGWSVALWDGSASKDPKPLAALDLSGVSAKSCPSRHTTDVKPEAMTLLESGNDFYRLLILFDGMCDGGPMSFRVQR